MTVFDSSGIEAWVAENNPKYTNRIIKQLKAYAKTMHFDENFDPYRATYASCLPMPPLILILSSFYIDGHFCYAYKFGIVTNGLGIVRHLDFYNRDFFQNILRSSSKRSPILQMKINLSMMPGCSSLLYRICLPPIRS